jgi:DNA adenine methylase
MTKVKEVKITKPQPFLKWAGGKTQLLNELLLRVPTGYGRYFEPFMGSGAFYFALSPKEAFIGDVNEELVNTFQMVKLFPNELIEQLKSHVNSSDDFYATRALDPGLLTPVERAARFIYLNRTCFNGLYRVNKSGQFNVPFANYKNPNIVQEEKIAAASKVLENTYITHGPYTELIKKAKKGDFVYLDPPYYPLGGYSDFKRYNKEGFYTEDQVNLSLLYGKLDKMGCFVMLSNSDTPFTRELYKDWNVSTVYAKRMINSDATKRGEITEILVTNYDY